MLPTLRTKRRISIRFMMRFVLNIRLLGINASNVPREVPVYRLNYWIPLSDCLQLYPYCMFLDTQSRDFYDTLLVSDSFVSMLLRIEIVTAQKGIKPVCSDISICPF